MSKRLIINADDYGRTPAVSRGIRAAHLNGVVTSTTCMMNLPNTVEEIQLAQREAPMLGLGVHLTLTADQPLVKREAVQSITDSHGNFLKLNVFTQQLNQIQIDEVKLEWRAQIEAFIQAAKQKPTHLDSHHHTSYFSAALLRAMLELAQEFECGIRLPLEYPAATMTGVPPEVVAAAKVYAPKLLREFNPTSPNGFFANFYGATATRAELLHIFETLPDGVFEIMCHPGYVDEALPRVSSYVYARETELKILSAAEIRAAISANQIELINFSKLTQTR
ncbi:MAG: ChbG/HpnK family deacetylase [Anaerolineales bacterium]|nr:ChbG/HpnK family deacetylase [Anaerolineales bacterium]